MAEDIITGHVADEKNDIANRVSSYELRSVTLCQVPRSADQYTVNSNISLLQRARSLLGDLLKVFMTATPGGFRWVEKAILELVHEHTSEAALSWATYQDSTQ